MANTTNFEWETPDDTDLVKDGAAAMRTLGNAIDTSMVDLKGGTTGQILSKTSNTDMDFTWIANDQGDITGVTAGTGLSGGGTSGAVTLSIDTATTADLTTSQTLTNKTLTAPKITLGYTAKTDTYTVANGDQNYLFTMNAATAKKFQIPTDATYNFPVGTEIHFAWITGAGQPSIEAVTSGTTTILSTGAFCDGTIAGSGAGDGGGGGGGEVIFGSSLVTQGQILNITIAGQAQGAFCYYFNQVAGPGGNGNNSCIVSPTINVVAYGGGVGGGYQNCANCDFTSCDPTKIGSGGGGAAVNPYRNPGINDARYCTQYLSNGGGYATLVCNNYRYGGGLGGGGDAGRAG